MLTLAGALALPPAAVAQTVTAAKAVGKTRIVFQVSDADPQKWNLALANVRNVMVDLGADAVEIEIVAYGPGIGMLKADSPLAQRIDESLRAGVKVLACENTMKALALSRDDMAGGIGYVRAGVVELVQRQQQGWAYIRP